MPVSIAPQKYQENSRKSDECGALPKFAHFIFRIRISTASPHTEHTHNISSFTQVLGLHLKHMTHIHGYSGVILECISRSNNTWR